MSESVEQAALRRAETDPRVVSALESMSRIVEADGKTHVLFREALDLLTEDTRAQWDAIAELRDGLLALSNRIETLTRTVTAHHGQLAQLLGHSPLDEVSA